MSAELLRTIGRGDPSAPRAPAAARLRVVAALVATALSLAACQGADEAPDRKRLVPPATSAAAPACSCPDAAQPVVDPALLAFLSKARAAHHQADLAIEQSDARRAIAALERVVSDPRPGGRAPSPEVTEVMADTRARLAGLRAELGEFDLARADIDAGLALATRPTHFRGHLFEVKGVVLERQASRLKEQGDAVGAERARSAAMEAFEAAIKIQDQVIAEALPAAPAAPSAPR